MTTKERIEESWEDRFEKGFSEFWDSHFCDDYDSVLQYSLTFIRTLVEEEVGQERERTIDLVLSRVNSYGFKQYILGKYNLVEKKPHQDNLTP